MASRLHARIILTAILMSQALHTAPAAADPAAEYGARPPFPITNADEVATDALGRSLPTHAEVGDPKPDRWVGVFYWHWHTPTTRWWAHFNMSEYLETHPRAKLFEVRPEGFPEHPLWYWDEPIFGYYQSRDPWVLRKHMVMLADAGVDFVFLDYTNDAVYDAELEAHLKVARDLKNAGVNVPQITFFLNSEPDWKAYHLWEKYYQDPQWDGLWFRWRGKPLLMTGPLKPDGKYRDGQDAGRIGEINDFFTFRKTWAYGPAEKEGLWRFTHGVESPVAPDPEGRPEQIVVNKGTGAPIHGAFAEGGVSWTPDTKPFEDGDYDDQWQLPDVREGKFFQAAWDRARELHPPIVLMTGWNEWTANVWDSHPNVGWFGEPYDQAGGHGYLVDQFSTQFNRDVEPTRGDSGDDYYWQFVANMRRHKGMLPPQPVSPPKTIELGGDGGAWADVTPRYADAPNDAARRDHPAKAPVADYVNDSARNDVALAQVARDGENVYFHVAAADALSEPDERWMWLLIDSDGDAATGWHGYDLLINRSRAGGEARIERNVGGRWEWEPAGAARLAVSGDRLELAVPRAIFGGGPLRFDFKWADNLPAGPTWADFYTEGDVAPDTRFNYRYEAE